MEGMLHIVILHVQGVGVVVDYGDIIAVALEVAGLGIVREDVVEVRGEHVADFGAGDRAGNFHAAGLVSGHDIRGGKIALARFAITEAIDAGMLQETAMLVKASHAMHFNTLVEQLRGLYD